MLRRTLALALLAGLTIAAAVPSFAARRRAVRLINGMPEVQRVFIVVLENEDAATALRQPFLAELASRGAYLDDFYALMHPSQPNYIGLTAGHTWGVIDNEVVSLDVRHIGDLLEAKGKSWKVYAEDYPGGCYLGETDRGYVRRHVPFLSYVNVQRSWARCTRVVNATELDTDLARGTLPHFSLYVPNVSNDGHDTGVEFADAWLRRRFEPLLTDTAFIGRTLFVVVFDESRTDPNLIYGALYGAGIEPGTVSGKRYDLYDLLRTIEEIFHTGTLGVFDARAAVIDDVWKK